MIKAPFFIRIILLLLEFYDFSTMHCKQYGTGHTKHEQKEQKAFFSYKMNIKHNSISSKGRRRRGRRVKFVCFLVHTKTNSLSLIHTYTNPHTHTYTHTHTQRERERERLSQCEKNESIKENG
jgi:hypothetical protein